MRRAVGVFQLPQNLRLADDHGVEACSHLERMVDGGVAFKTVEVFLQAGLGMPLLQPRCRVRG